MTQKITCRACDAIHDLDIDGLDIDISQLDEDSVLATINCECGESIDVLPGDLSDSIGIEPSIDDLENPDVADGDQAEDIAAPESTNSIFSDTEEDEFEDEDEASNTSWMMAASLILLIMVVVVFAVTYFGGEAEKIQISDPEGLLSLKVSESGEQIPPDSPMMLPGLIKPSTITAEEAAVDDGEQILGVSVDDAHRAYLLSSFNLIGQKIVNDIVNRVPLTVTYCRVNKKGRVFTSDQRGENLELDLYAWEKGELVFELNDNPFNMFDENPPLDDYAFILTTWGEWKTRHPNTDIYTGEAKIPVRRDE